MDIKKIVSRFMIDGEFMAYNPYGDGHINDTYALTFRTDKCLKRYILQRINTNVFPNVEGLMSNVMKVTGYLRDKVIERSGDPDRECLNIILTKEGESYYIDEDSNCWRVTLLVENTEAYQIAVDPKIYKETGKAFGEFIRTLDDFPVSELCIVLPKFHNTVDRYNKFRHALKENACKRRRYCREEVAFVKEREEMCDKIINLLADGQIPIRVTHNDTKINNILMDSNTGRPVCVIDLDTIMPGSLIYDFGDGIRSGCNTGMEDEKDLSKVNFDMEMFKNFTQGFVEGVGESLTQTEKDNLVYGAILITFECGMRFLTDYLMGDVYFKTEYSNHNLVRAKTQFKLVKDMEDLRAEMEEYVASL